MLEIEPQATALLPKAAKTINLRVGPRVATHDHATASIQANVVVTPFHMAGTTGTASATRTVPTIPASPAAAAAPDYCC